MNVAQNRMKQHSDQKRSKRSFKPWDYLKLHPYRQRSLINRPSLKLAPCVYWPFQVAARIDIVAYKLTLSHQWKLHSIFHVSLLNKKIGDHTPCLLNSSTLWWQWTPHRVLDMAIFKKRNRTVTKCQWIGLRLTWGRRYLGGTSHSIMNRFPSFHARGQAASQGVGIVRIHPSLNSIHQLPIT